MVPAGHPARHVAGPTDLKVLVHGHFHYPELVDELLARLGTNRQQVDLRLSTTSEHKEIDLRRRLERAGVSRWQVDLVENRGRDLAPLFTGLGHEVLDDYDVVLHVHGKRSPHVAGDVADRWRNFLWENLIGGRAPMMDTICEAFATDDQLGLVAPEDPHLNDWDLNREDGERLAKRLGMTQALTTHLDFPMGGMFWARTSALRHLLDARLQWDEYPPEPLPIDGTMLHALERIIRSRSRRPASGSPSRPSPASAAEPSGPLTGRARRPGEIRTRNFGRITENRLVTPAVTSTVSTPWAHVAAPPP